MYATFFAPSLVAPVATIFNFILRTVYMPTALSNLYIILLDKPKSPTGLCKSKSPISLISVLPKALGTLVLNRMMDQLEGRRVDSQYAYRRVRGTEHHLLELADLTREMRPKGCGV